MRADEKQSSFWRDLDRWGGEVGAGANPSGVDDVSNGVPCTDRELVSAVETVAGVYGVVAAGLTVAECVPAIGLNRCGFNSRSGCGYRCRGGGWCWGWFGPLVYEYCLDPSIGVGGGVRSQYEFAGDG